SSFFFYSHLDLCDLHSFPTRRSSDLFSKHSLSLTRLPRKSTRRNSSTASFSIGAKEVRFESAKLTIKRGRSDLAPPFWINGRLLDRKSTRLNSSHVAISYAVFCLKKK